MESSSRQSDDDGGRIEIDILAIGKKARLSFQEMNELRLVDFFDLVKSYTGTREKKATQKDIDNFFA